MADEGLDEVKVFRKIDTDTVDDEGEDDQLFADKQDVAAEAEIEEEGGIQGLPFLYQRHVLIMQF